MTYTCCCCRRRGCWRAQVQGDITWLGKRGERGGSGGRGRLCGTSLAARPDAHRPCSALYTCSLSSTETMLLLLLVLVLVLQFTDQTSVAPDVTGLVGTPFFYDIQAQGPNAVRLPLKFWANPRDSALRPRRRDRNPHTLMRLLGDDFDPHWMRRTRREDKLLNATSRPMADMAPEEERRPSVQSLWEAALALQPPTTWPTPPPGMTMPEDSSGSPAAWLVALATCPARTEWRDLGVFFWPRLVRREECERGTARRKPGASSVPLGCGWPPGRLTCAPGVTRTLHLLRWHCRLRDAAEETWTRLAQVMTPGKVPPQPPPRRKRRERYRCEWLKVPYPVPADCQCGGI